MRAPHRLQPLYILHTSSATHASHACDVKKYCHGTGNAAQRREAPLWRVQEAARSAASHFAVLPFSARGKKCINNKEE
jgi:hypothetical protein